jgi:hypothetical protein
MIASFNFECRRDAESFTFLGGHICTTKNHVKTNYTFEVTNKNIILDTHTEQKVF